MFLRDMVHLYISLDPFRSESALLFNLPLYRSLLAGALATRPSASTVGGLRMITTTLQRGDINQRLKCRTKSRKHLLYSFAYASDCSGNPCSCTSLGHKCTQYLAVRKIYCGSSAPQNTFDPEMKTYAQLVLV